MKSRLAAALSGAMSSEMGQDVPDAGQQASLQSERDAHTLSSLPQGLQALAQQGLLPVSSQRLQVTLAY